MKKIFVFHLLNDFSGSPKVLSQMIKAWNSAGHDIHLHTSGNRQGLLSGLSNVTEYDNHYRFYKPVLMRLFSLMWTQLLLIISMFTKVKKGDVIYINTILPFGAAVLGKLKGVKVVYHIHETSINPLIFKRFLMYWVKSCSSKVIYVSNFLAQQEPLKVPSTVLWNSIDDDFVSEANSYDKEEREFNNILMIASLKKYKGVDEFVEISSKSPTLNYTLVVNAAQEDIDHYFNHTELPKNLKIYPTQSNVHPFYQSADVVMNLSRPDEWKETFGLTALEAMTYSLPVIVPPVGGIAEIVVDGHTGFHINGTMTKDIINILHTMKKDKHYYQTLCKNAKIHSQSFTESILIGDEFEDF